MANLSIGQGDLLVTPIQMAQAMATLAKPASVVTFPVTGARPTE